MSPLQAQDRHVCIYVIDYYEYNTRFVTSTELQCLS